MTQTLKENIFNLFEEAEKVFDIVINKLKNREDIFSEFGSPEGGKYKVTVKYRPGFLVIFSNTRKHIGGFFDLDNQRKLARIYLSFNKNIFDELDSLRTVFVHEYSHYIQRINLLKQAAQNPKQRKISKRKSEEERRKDPLHMFRSKRMYKKMGINPEDVDEREMYEREVGLEKPEESKKFDGDYFIRSERTAYVSEYLFFFYKYHALPAWNKMKQQITNLYLEGFYELEDVERKIELTLAREFSEFRKTLPLNIQTIFNGIKQRNSTSQQKKYIKSVMRKMTKKILDKFLEQI